MVLEKSVSSWSTDQRLALQTPISDGSADRNRHIGAQTAVLRSSCFGIFCVRISATRGSLGSAGREVLLLRETASGLKLGRCIRRRTRAGRTWKRDELNRSLFNPDADSIGTISKVSSLFSSGIFIGSASSPVWWPSSVSSSSAHGPVSRPMRTSLGPVDVSATRLRSLVGRSWQVRRWLRRGCVQAIWSCRLAPT